MPVASPQATTSSPQSITGSQARLLMAEKGVVEDQGRVEPENEGSSKRHPKGEGTTPHKKCVQRDKWLRMRRESWSLHSERTRGSRAQLWAGDFNLHTSAWSSRAAIHGQQSGPDD